MTSAFYQRNRTELPLRRTRTMRKFTQLNMLDNNTAQQCTYGHRFRYMLLAHTLSTLVI